MSEYRLDIVGDINLSDYSSIHDYMEIIQRNDKFTITSKMKNSEEVEILCEMLVSNYFAIIQQGGKENGQYSITSQKTR
jgi:predicted transcriptional regulator